MPRKNRKIVAAAAPVDPTPTPVAANGDTPPDATAAPAVNVNATPDAPPARRSFGGRHSLLPSALPVALLGAYAARPVSTHNRARAPFFLNLVLPDLTSGDAPALLSAAAACLASVASLLPGLSDALFPTFPDVTPLPVDALDTLTAYYYANHGKHSSDQSVSDLDRVQTATSVAEMLLSNHDRLTNRPGRRAYCGGYNGRGPSAVRRDSVAANVFAAMTAPVPVVP